MNCVHNCFADCALWIRLTKADKKRLEAFEVWIRRKMLEVSQKDT